MTMEEIHERLAQLFKGRVPGWGGGPWWGDPHKYAAGMILNWGRFMQRDPKRDVQVLEEYQYHDVIAFLNQALEAHARGEAFPPEPEQSHFIEADELTEKMRNVDDPDVDHCPRCGHLSGVLETFNIKSSHPGHFGYCLEHRLKWDVLVQYPDLDERRNPFLTLLHWQADKDYLASFETVVGVPTEEMTKAAKEAEDRRYAEAMEYMRGKPIDHAPGCVGWVQATFAKILVETNSDLLELENRDKLMEALEGVLDRKQAFERAASLGITLTPEQVAAMNVRRASGLPF